jgi:hypothetical protein
LRGQRAGECGEKEQEGVEEGERGGGSEEKANFKRKETSIKEEASVKASRRSTVENALISWESLY